MKQTKSMEAMQPEALGDSPLLPELLYGKLRHNILNGSLEPGQLLRQEELARRFNVSRVPLREAMSRLEADGLVVLRPRRGYAVTSLDQSDIVEIFELRAVVEEHAASVAAHARTPHDVVEVSRILDDMEALDPKQPGYLDEWSRWNYSFHARLIGSTRRKRLSRVAGALRDTVEPYIRVEARMTGDVRDAEREHREIFDAFRAGDARGLAELCRAHVENTAKRLLEGVRKSKLPPSHVPAPLSLGSADQVLDRVGWEVAASQSPHRKKSSRRSNV
jgi:DNA-binding GntR family transcriptional regulator